MTAKSLGGSRSRGFTISDLRDSPRRQRRILLAKLLVDSRGVFVGSPRSVFSTGPWVLPEDEPWQNAQDVWNELPNSKVASAYIQAYRIAGNV
jgi:hypothetical protein